MTSREKNLMRIYRECFKNPEIKNFLNEDWFYVCQCLEAGEEDTISDGVLEMIIEWLNEI